MKTYNKNEIIELIISSSSKRVYLKKDVISESILSKVDAIKFILVSKSPYFWIEYQNKFVLNIGQIVENYNVTI